MRTLRIWPLLCMTFLAACSGGTVKDSLGLNRKAPDEFRVVSRPPLSVPPQFELRPPAAPGEVTRSQDADKKAQSLLLGNSIKGDGNKFILPSGNADAVPVAVPAGKPPVVTSPESNFLERAGIQQADPNVRRALDQDHATAGRPVAAEEEESSWWDVFSTGTSKPDPLVNAQGEADRIRSNKDSGKPVTEGDTPEVKQKDRGVLGRILGNGD